jgi:hypothetical protein
VNGADPAVPSSPNLPRDRAITDTCAATSTTMPGTKRVHGLALHLALDADFVARRQYRRRCSSQPRLRANFPSDSPLCRQCRITLLPSSSIASGSRPRVSGFERTGGRMPYSGLTR